MCMIRLLIASCRTGTVAQAGDVDELLQSSMGPFSVATSSVAYLGHCGMAALHAVDHCHMLRYGPYRVPHYVKYPVSMTCRWKLPLSVVKCYRLPQNGRVLAIGVAGKAVDDVGWKADRAVKGGAEGWAVWTKREGQHEQGGKANSRILQGGDGST